MEKTNAVENKKAFDLKAELLALTQREEVTITIRPQAIAATFAPLVGALKAQTNAHFESQKHFESLDEKVDTLETFLDITKNKVMPDIFDAAANVLRELYRLFLVDSALPLAELKEKRSADLFKDLVDIK